VIISYYAAMYETRKATPHCLVRRGRASSSPIRPTTCRFTGMSPASVASRHGNFAMAAGEMSDDDYNEFLRSGLSCMADALVDGGIAFVCIDWRHVEQAIRASKLAGFALKNICVWVKTNGGMGTFYRSQHEFVLVSRKATLRTSIASGSGILAVTAQTSGNTRASTPLGANA
jgi:hypothetical protein